MEVLLVADRIITHSLSTILKNKFVKKPNKLSYVSTFFGNDVYVGGLKTKMLWIRRRSPFPMLGNQKVH